MFTHTLENGRSATDRLGKRAATQLRPKRERPSLSAERAQVQQPEATTPDGDNVAANLLRSGSPEPLARRLTGASTGTARASMTARLEQSQRSHQRSDSWSNPMAGPGAACSG
jgi:hypothetical protein